MVIAKTRLSPLIRVVFSTSAVMYTFAPTWSKVPGIRYSCLPTQWIGWPSRSRRGQASGPNRSKSPSPRISPRLTPPHYHHLNTGTNVAPNPPHLSIFSLLSTSLPLLLSSTRNPLTQQPRQIDLSRNGRSRAAVRPIHSVRRACWRKCRTAWQPAHCRTTSCRWSLLEFERCRGELQEEGMLRWMVLLLRFSSTATGVLEHYVPAYNALMARERSASVRRLCMPSWRFHQVLAVAPQYHVNPSRPSTQPATTLPDVYCAERRHYNCSSHNNLRDLDRSSSLRRLKLIP